MKRNFLDQLNPAQRDAVQTTSGPMLVLAGAGSGKTRVVTFRIARLVSLGTPADRILAVTFTNKAAAEMRQRVAQLLGPKRKDKAEAQISTFHSLCVKVLRRHIEQLGYPAKFSIYATSQQESVARKVLRDVDVAGVLLKPSDLVYMISQWKSRCVRPRDAVSLASTDKEHLAAIGYRRYQRALKSAGAVDFDDLLLCTEELFAKHPKVRRAEANRFDQILIDEYQDTNGSQYRIIRALAAGHRNLCVVGDDDQSIYGWRGADLQHILRFTKDWPEAKVIRLEENYRSTEEILAVANRLIAYNKDRYDKVLRAGRPGGEKPRVRQSEDEILEAKEVVTDIQRRLQQHGTEPRDFAILFRTNEQPRLFETELRQADLPYLLIGSHSFFDRKEVRDVLAYLRLLENPTDEAALLRVLNTPPRGIGDKTAQALIETAIANRITVWDVLGRRELYPNLNGTSQAAINRFVHVIGDYRERLRSGNLVESASKLINAIGYRNEIRRIYQTEEEQDSRWTAVEEVINALGQYQSNKQKPSLGDFLDDLALLERDRADDKESQLRRNAIVLMTLHAAKGLEFPHVYLVGLEEGFLPHHRSIAMEGNAVEEERRLCYVGVTRAQETLTFSLALTRRKWGKPRERQPSRFLFEIVGSADNPHRPG